MTKGSVHDGAGAKSLLGSLQGLAFGDKGYIGKKLFDELFKSGLKLIIRKRKNIKEKLELNVFEKQLLNQRNIIETIFNCLKKISHLAHSASLDHKGNRKPASCLLIRTVYQK